MTINRDCLHKSYGPVHTKVEASSIEAYADATLDPLMIYRSDEPVAPPVFGIVPIWPAVQGALADDELGIDVGRVVHGEQRMTFHRLIRAGDVLRSEGRISSISEKGANEVFVLSFETSDSRGSLVTSQDVVCVSRGTAQGNAGTSGERKRSSPEASREQPSFVRAVTLPDDITFRYAKASGDDNRIHIDDDFARQVGLPGIIVQGMCLFAIAVQAVIGGPCAEDPSRLSAASVRFMRPIRPGSAFEVSVFERREGLAFAGQGPDGEVVLRGAAEVPHDHGRRDAALSTDFWRSQHAGRGQTSKRR
jgi:acyl dehydratase